MIDPSPAPAETGNDPKLRAANPVVDPGSGDVFVDDVGIDAPAADDPLSETTLRRTARPDAGQPGAARDGAHSLIRSSLVVSSLTMVSRVLGFLRDLAVSYTMGASASFATCSGGSSPRARSRPPSCRPIPNRWPRTAKKSPTS